MNTPTLAINVVCSDADISNHVAYHQDIFTSQLNREAWCRLAAQTGIDPVSYVIALACKLAEPMPKY